MHTRGVRHAYRALIILAAVIAAVLPLAACAAKVTITQPDGSVVRMTEALYAHQLSTQAYMQRSSAEANCFAAAGNISAAQPSTNELNGPLMLSICQQGGGQQQAQVPQFVAPPTLVDRIVQLGPTLLGAGQLVQADRASERQAVLQRDMARISADERIATIGAFVGVSQAGYNALTTTAGRGFDAVSTTAVAGFQANAATSVAGFDALERLGSNAVDAQAQATGAWAATIADLQPTYRLGDNSALVVGHGNTTQTGAGLIDQSQVGRDRDVTRECINTQSQTVSNSQAGSTAGGTGTSGGSLGFSPYPQQPATIDCGG